MFPERIPIIATRSHFLRRAKLKDRIAVGDIVKFFVQYMKNDQLGKIANAHLGMLPGELF
jgi:RNA dependent RNA polymerase